MKIPEYDLEKNYPILDSEKLLKEFLRLCKITNELEFYSIADASETLDKILCILHAWLAKQRQPAD